MAFRVVLTEYAWKTLENDVDYILYNFKDAFAADNLYSDIEGTLNLLKNNPEAFNFCNNEDFQKKGIRKVHLKKHRYKIFYHIVDHREVQIDAILHDSQDFENILRQQFD